MLGASRGCLRNLLRDESVGIVGHNTVNGCEVTEVDDDATLSNSEMRHCALHALECQRFNMQTFESLSSEISKNLRDSIMEIQNESNDFILGTLKIWF